MRQPASPDRLESFPDRQWQNEMRLYDTTNPAHVYDSLLSKTEIDETPFVNHS